MTRNTCTPGQTNDTASSSTTGPDGLVQQKSEFSPSVTLFALDSLGPNGSAELRRSPRKRAKIEYDESAIEDSHLEVARVSPLIALKNKIAQGKGKDSSKGQGQRRRPEEKIANTSRRAKGKAKVSSTPVKAKAKAKPKTPKAIPSTLANPHPAPEHWEEVYDLIKDMRSRIVAPVDTMGCDQAQYKESEPRNRRFATLVSLMLSSQTKDEVTDAAVTKLRAAVGGTLSIENVINADNDTIAEAINKVGFWRRKTEYIKQTALKLRSSFSSDVPKTVDELCSLPGVGPKMAFLALQVAWDLNHGIGVDVHVHRITNRLGWHRRPTKTPEETRLNLQSWLPKDRHREINHMLVGFGQVVCTPVNPKCGECVLSTNGLCPSARVVSEKDGKKKVTTVAGSRKRKVKIELEGDDGTGETRIKLEEALKDETLIKMEDTGVKVEGFD
ncbi:DNA-lyase [Ephemerocybe angulata]|uniref:Endonuclease III homolog n=1 Tax=Ephemerocybe angulata TaxID=980116 RepID=A0A8H6IH29_9AGAR|nr:DNA-lyase [Tulosesus angulatus]